MFEAMLSGAILGLGMILWNVRFERGALNLIRKYFEKKRDQDGAIFIDPR